MIIGISGLAGSGKDTAAEFLVEDHSFVRVGLADKLKRILKDVFDFTDEQLWGPSSERNKPDYRYKMSECPACGGDPKKTGQCEVGCVYLTARFAAQKLGTEWARACYLNVWVEDVLRTAKMLLNGPEYRYEKESGIYPSFSSSGYTETRGIVIPDVRFKNEMSCIRAAGGHLIRLKRGSGLSTEALDGTYSAHSSETEQLEVPDSYFSAVIDNNKLSLEELREEVRRVYVNLC